MKKGDDFFRVTFKRDLEEILNFEKNISEYSRQSGISRPILIATICNNFFENGVELCISSGKIAAKGVAGHSGDVSDNSAPVVAYIESDSKEEELMISESDSDAMLRAMGLI